LIAIVTDSTSDIEPQQAAHLGIDVVPLFVLWGNRSYRDYVDLTRADFYERLKREPELPTTSQPTSAMFEAAFAPHVRAARDIVCISVSAKLSGTINAARAAAAQFPQSRITVVDSESVAGGLGMMVRRANAMARRGADTAQLLEAIEQDKRTQRLYACLADLSHLVRTGRIGRAQSAIGTLMKITPVLSLVDGQIASQAQVRTPARALETMLDLSMASISNVSEARFLIMHTNAPDLASTVVERLRVRLGRIEPRSLDTEEAGPVIAVHGGPGAVGIFSAQDA
jgi:DegV family protein with EDD domain